MACFLCFLKSKAKSPWETFETEVSNTVGTPNSPVFSRVVFKKSEMLSWSGSLMGVVSPSTEVVLSSGIGQVAKLLGTGAEVRLTRACGSGEARRRRCGREPGVEVTVWEQQGWRMKHENRESEMRICDMHTANTLSHACTRYLYATQRKCACDRRMCVQDVLGDVIRQQYIVLQCKINESTSWMSLDCSEIQEKFGRIRVQSILNPFLRSSSLRQESYPSFNCPLRSTIKLWLKLLCQVVKSYCSIIFWMNWLVLSQ